MLRSPALLVLLALVAGLVVGPTAAAPPRPGTDDNGLTRNESATLWSRDDESGYITNADYRTAYGENRTTIQEIANGTDLTFTRPPATAAIWTSNDHADFDGTNASASLYPPGANRTDGRLIQDAHVTVFGLAPATMTHVAPTETRRYVAPNGTVRSIVDYRIRQPAADAGGNASRRWTGQHHEITEVRLIVDGETVARTNGSHTPTLAYHLAAGQTTLRIEADIEARLGASAGIGGDPDGRENGSGTVDSRRVNGTDVVVETVTVTDTVRVTPYHLRTTFRYATYPNGDAGVAVYKNLPWQGLDVSPTDDRQVRGVWRFYTARNPRWDQLTRATASGNETVTSPSIPVAVHAYPSTLGPRVEPTGDGPGLLQLWGTDHASPASHLPQNVTVDVVTEAYETSYGLAVRTDSLDREALTVRGIVRGVNATLVEPDGGSRRQIRESTLTLTVLDQSADGAVLLVTLRATDTGNPITLADQTARYDPVIPDRREGYVTVAGRRVTPNASGMATVRVTEPGVYTAVYHPGSWLAHDPAFTSARATARWHPLATVDGWLSLGTTVVTWALPFALALYAGRRLGDIIHYQTNRL